MVTRKKIAKPFSMGSRKSIVTAQFLLSNKITDKSEQATFSMLRELSFFSSRGGGGLVETGGSRKHNRLKRGDQEKNNVIEGGDQTFLLHRFKKKSNGYV